MSLNNNLITHNIFYILNIIVMYKIAVLKIKFRNYKIFNL